MNKDINNVLARLRARLDEDTMCSAAGYTNDKSFPVVRLSSRNEGYSHHDPKAQFFAMLDDLADKLSRRKGLDEEQAFYQIADIGDLLHSIGALPPYPDDEMSEAEIARWMNAAMIADFPRRVLRRLGLGES